MHAREVGGMRRGTLRTGGRQVAMRARRVREYGGRGCNYERWGLDGVGVLDMGNGRALHCVVADVGMREYSGAATTRPYDSCGAERRVYIAKEGKGTVLRCMCGV